VVVVPASVTVAAGQTSSPAFTVTTQPVAASTPVTITATLGGISQQRTLAVEPTRPQSVSLTPPTVVGGAASSGTVTLTGNAPAGGAVVSLSSSQPTVASVPASVTVAAGAKVSPAFGVTTQAVAQSISVTITATRAGVSQTAALTVNPAQPTALTLNLGAVTGGGSVTGTVTLSGPAPAGGVVVNLNSSHPAAAVPASVLVAAGLSAASFTVATQLVSQATLVAITASRAGVTQAAMLTVNPPPVALGSLSLLPTSVFKGASSQGTVTLTVPAPAGGAVVHLSSDFTTVATVPATVTVPGGQTTATFTVSTKTTAIIDVAEFVTITAVCGTTREAVLTVKVFTKPF
jgi:hypothetical protein